MNLMSWSTTLAEESCNAKKKKVGRLCPCVLTLPRADSLFPSKHLTSGSLSSAPALAITCFIARGHFTDHGFLVGHRSLSQTSLGLVTTGQVYKADRCSQTCCPIHTSSSLSLLPIHRLIVSVSFHNSLRSFTPFATPFPPISLLLFHTFATHLHLYPLVSPELAEISGLG